MPKPIALLYIPPEINLNHLGGNVAMQLMQIFNNNFGEPPDNLQNFKTTDFWTEYFWLCFNKPGLTAPELQVFHPKDFNEIQYEELKQLVLSELEKLK